MVVGWGGKKKEKWPPQRGCYLQGQGHSEGLCNEIAPCGIIKSFFYNLIENVTVFDYI